MTTAIVSLVPPGAATRRRIAAGLAVVGAAVAILSVVFVVEGARPDEAAGRAVIELLVVGLPLAAGLYAVHSGHDVRFGAALVGAGFAWSATALGESSASVPYSIGRLAAWLVFPWLIYLMLSFPEGRVAGRLDRGLLLGLNAVPAAAASMARRWRTATPLRRQTIGPVVAVSGVSVCLLAAFFVARSRSGDSTAAVTLGVPWSLCIPALAAAFFAGLLQRRLILGNVLEDLGMLLSTQADAPRLRDAIAAALRDPTIDVLVPDGPAHWRDSGGRPADLTAVAADGRNVTVIREDGIAEVALVHDSHLLADDEILRAVGALALAGLRHERMRSRLAASLAQLETSRRRIAGAADQERARIERDLHDGAQQRLIALRVGLTLVEELLRRDPDAGTAALVALGDEVDLTLDELRSLAHGVYPSMLRDRGPAAALRGVAAQSPLPVRVPAFGLTRHSADIDTAVYFTCLEALQNVVKHAPTASGVRITLRQDMMLTVEARDDGPGFDPRSAEDHGSGLRNMRDRIEAVGGTLTIESAPGRGTRILAFVPLG